MVGLVVEDEEGDRVGLEPQRCRADRRRPVRGAQQRRVRERVAGEARPARGQRRVAHPLARRRHRRDRGGRRRRRRSRIGGAWRRGRRARPRYRSRSSARPGRRRPPGSGTSWSTSFDVKFAPSAGSSTQRAIAGELLIAGLRSATLRSHTAATPWSDLSPTSTPASISASTSAQRISSVSVCSRMSSQADRRERSSTADLMSRAVALVVVPMMPPSDCPRVDDVRRIDLERRRRRARAAQRSRSCTRGAAGLRDRTTRCRSSTVWRMLSRVWPRSAERIGAKHCGNCGRVGRACRRTAPRIGDLDRAATVVDEVDRDRREVPRRCASCGANANSALFELVRPWPNTTVGQPAAGRGARRNEDEHLQLRVGSAPRRCDRIAPRARDRRATRERVRQRAPDSSSVTNHAAEDVADRGAADLPADRVAGGVDLPAPRARRAAAAPSVILRKHCVLLSPPGHGCTESALRSGRAARARTPTSRSHTTDCMPSSRCSSAPRRPGCPRRSDRAGRSWSAS